MKRYSFISFLQLSFCYAVALSASHAHAMQSAVPGQAAKSAAFLFFKRACGYTALGSTTFFVGHEWGKSKGFQEGFFAGEIHITADITKQISEQALTAAKIKIKKK